METPVTNPIVLLSLLLIGCGDKDPSDSGPPSEDTGPSSTDPDPETDTDSGVDEGSACVAVGLFPRTVSWSGAELVELRLDGVDPSAVASVAMVLDDGSRVVLDSLLADADAGQLWAAGAPDAQDALGARAFSVEVNGEGVPDELPGGAVLRFRLDPEELPDLVVPLDADPPADLLPLGLVATAAVATDGGVTVYAATEEEVVVQSRAAGAWDPAPVYLQHRREPVAGGLSSMAGGGGPLASSWNSDSGVRHDFLALHDGAKPGEVVAERSQLALAHLTDDEAGALSLLAVYPLTYASAGLEAPGTADAIVPQLVVAHPTFGREGTVDLLNSVAWGTSSKNGAEVLQGLAWKAGGPAELLWARELSEPLRYASGVVRNRSGRDVFLALVGSGTPTLVEIELASGELVAEYPVDDLAGGVVAFDSARVAGVGDEADRLMLAAIGADGVVLWGELAMAGGGNPQLGQIAPSSRQMLTDPTSSAPWRSAKGPGEPVVRVSPYADADSAPAVSITVESDGTVVLTTWRRRGPVALVGRTTDPGGSPAPDDVSSTLRLNLRGPELRPSYRVTRTTGDMSIPAPVGATSIVPLRTTEGRPGAGGALVGAPTTALALVQEQDARLPLAVHGGFTLVSSGGATVSVEYPSEGWESALPLAPGAGLSTATVTLEGEQLLVVAGIGEDDGAPTLIVVDPDGTVSRATLSLADGSELDGVALADGGDGLALRTTWTDAEGSRHVGPIPWMSPESLPSGGDFTELVLAPAAWPEALSPEHADLLWSLPFLTLPDGHIAALDVLDQPLADIDGVQSLAALAGESALPDIVAVLPVSDGDGTCPVATFLVPGLSADPSENLAAAVRLSSASRPDCADLALPEAVADLDGQGPGSIFLSAATDPSNPYSPRLLWEVRWDGAQLLALPGTELPWFHGVTAADLDGDGLDELWLATADTGADDGQFDPPLSGMVLRGRGEFLGRGMAAEVRRLVDATAAAATLPGGSWSSAPLAAEDPSVEVIVVGGTHGMVLSGWRDGLTPVLLSSWGRVLD